MIYDGLLTGVQIKVLERLQANALKTIYGWEKSYSTVLRLSGLKKLSDRRREATERFARKTEQNPRFSQRWFPRRQETGHGLRRQDAYREDLARHERLKNAPMYRMRRILNGGTTIEEDHDFAELDE